MERLAKRISSISDMSSVVPEMGGQWINGRYSESIGSGPEGSRKIGFIRMFHRWLLLRGKKGGSCVGPTKRGKGTKIMAIADRNGLPIAIHIDSASPHEAKLVERTIDNRFVRRNPRRLIGDKAYDSDPLDKKLKKRCIVMIAPHKKNRKKPKTQDGRCLRRYKKRWKIERVFAWIHNFRKAVTRYEVKAENFLAFVKLACIMILLNRYF